MSTRIKSSGLLIISQIVKLSAGYLYGFHLIRNANQTVTGILYDNTVSAGLILSKLVIPSQASDPTRSIKWEVPVWCQKGMFLELIGNAQAIIYFD